MKNFIYKHKKIIIAIVIIILIVGSFSVYNIIRLKKLSEKKYGPLPYSYLYELNQNITQEEKLTLLANMGINIETFKEEGFSFDDATINVFNETGTDILHSINIKLGDDISYHINLTIYLPNKQIPYLEIKTFKSYFIGNIEVGFYEFSEGVREEIWYIDKNTNYTYLFQLSYGLDEPTEKFFNILINK